LVLFVDPGQAHLSAFTINIDIPQSSGGERINAAQTSSRIEAVGGPSSSATDRRLRDKGEE
jgi:hypothetical protein